MNITSHDPMPILKGIEDYLHWRSFLANKASSFQCVSTCTRPGCKRKNIQVSVSLIDLIGSAAYTKSSILEVYRQNYILSLRSRNNNGWIWSLAIMLKKPCPYLENERCRIYPYRPLACVLFPEASAVNRSLEKKRMKPVYRECLCFNEPINVSRERGEILSSLDQTSEREWLISGYYLYKYSPFYIDFSNCMKEIRRMIDDLYGFLHQDRKVYPEKIPLWHIEKYFLSRVTRCDPIALVEDKIKNLENIDEQTHFFELLRNEALWRELRQSEHERKFVFRFVDGELKPV